MERFAPNTNITDDIHVADHTQRRPEMKDAQGKRVNEGNRPVSNEHGEVPEQGYPNTKDASRLGIDHEPERYRSEERAISKPGSRQQEEYRRK
jgi:hypothetical protein